MRSEWHLRNKSGTRREHPGAGFGNAWSRLWGQCDNAAPDHERVEPLPSAAVAVGVSTVAVADAWRRSTAAADLPLPPGYLHALRARGPLQWPVQGERDPMAQRHHGQLFHSDADDAVRDSEHLHVQRHERD